MKDVILSCLVAAILVASCGPSLQSLKENCEHEDLKACSILATRYMRGSDGAYKSPSKARDIYYRTCAKGYSAACAALAIQYEYGWDLKKDIEMAIKMHRKACELKHQMSCDTLKKLEGSPEGKIAAACRDAGSAECMKACRQGNTPSCVAACRHGVLSACEKCKFRDKACDEKLGIKTIGKQGNLIMEVPFSAGETFRARVEVLAGGDVDVFFMDNKNMEKYRRKIKDSWIKSTLQETNVTKYDKVVRKPDSRMYLIVDNTVFPDGGAYGFKTITLKVELEKAP